MQFHRLTVVALVFAVALAGCAGVVPGGGSNDTATPPPTGTPADTTTATPPATPTATPTSTATPTESWTPPSGPENSTEDKSEPGRFMTVQFVNKREAESGSGYSEFDVDVLADTRMQNVDPGPDGTAERTGEGEPYFLVTVNDTLIARTDVVERTRYGTFPISIPASALSQFDAGTLDVQVLMMDRDSHHDDLYRRWNGTIEYSP